MSDEQNAQTQTEVATNAVKIRIMGVADLDYAVPATVEAYDTLAKRQGRCLEDAVAKTLFHSSYGVIRAGITKALIEAGLGTPKLFATSKKIEVTEVFEGEGDDKKLTGYVDAKGKEYKADTDISVESDKNFFDRVCAEQGVEADHFRDLIQKVCDNNKFDPSVRERGTGQRKIAKTYIAAAQEIVDANAHEGVAQQLSEILNRMVDVSDPETRVLVLATAISDQEAAERREKEANLKNKYLALSK